MTKHVGISDMAMSRALRHRHVVDCETFRGTRHQWGIIGFFRANRAGIGMVTVPRWVWCQDGEAWVWRPLHVELDAMSRWEGRGVVAS